MDLIKLVITGMILGDCCLHQGKLGFHKLWAAISQRHLVGVGLPIAFIYSMQTLSVAAQFL
jgi:hypothetical protein